MTRARWFDGRHWRCGRADASTIRVPVDGILGLMCQKPMPQRTRHSHAGVAQLVRARGSYPRCPGFKSLHRHHYLTAGVTGVRTHVHLSTTRRCLVSDSGQA